MSRKARHLLILEDSKKEMYNFDKPSKIKSRIFQIIDTRYNEIRNQANLYAIKALEKNRQIN